MAARPAGGGGSRPKPKLQKAKAPVLSAAGAADVLLVSVRDGVYRQQLASLVNSVAESELALGGRAAVALQPELEALSDLLYCSVTTLSGQQTLGEEAVGAVRATVEEIPGVGGTPTRIRVHPLRLWHRVLLSATTVLSSYWAKVHWA